MGDRLSKLIRWAESKDEDWPVSHGMLPPPDWGKLWLALASAFLTFVVGAEVWYALPDNLRRSAVPASVLSLDPYEMVDSRCPVHWKLRPGYDDGEVWVGPRGFRNGSSQAPRVLVVGDSCVFGIGGGLVSGLQVNLGRRVINGGVEGYSVRNLACRLPDYQALEPEITLVYVGWNNLFLDGPAYSSLGAVRLLQRAWGFARERWLPRERYWKYVYVDYVPTFLGELEHLVGELPGRVVLITLPGLYSVHYPPSEGALRMGHLPAHTDNAYVLAATTARYNDELRLMGERLGIQVIDADRYWLHGEADFIDSVHLTPEAQVRLGVWMAAELNAIDPRWN
jgi:hypothetical protein